MFNCNRWNHLSTTTVKQPMTIFPFTRTQYTFQELCALWQCTANDLRDAIVTKKIVPSIAFKGIGWDMELTEAGTFRRKKIGTNIDSLMYLVGVQRRDAFDCVFDHLSHDPGGIFRFVPDQSPYVNGRKRLSEIEGQCVFTTVEIERARPKSEGASTPTKGQWWNTEYDPMRMAREIEDEWLRQGRQPTQSGPRHGKFGRLLIADAVARKIFDLEKLTSGKRSIGGKSIETFMKNHGWD